MTLKFVEHSGSVDLTGWVFNFGENLDPIIAKNLTEAMKNTIQDFEPGAYLPFQWGDSDGIFGGPVEPLTIYFSFPVGNVDNGNDGYLYWSTTLNELVGDLLYDTEKEICQKLSTALRKLADDIDMKLEKTE